MNTKRIFRLEVRLEGEAFGVAGEWGEVARILRLVAGEMESSRDPLFTKPLRDYSGKPCGGAWVSVEPADRLAFKRSSRPGQRFTSDG